jgi:hypothetical protein
VGQRPERRGTANEKSKETNPRHDYSKFIYKENYYTNFEIISERRGAR